MDCNHEYSEGKSAIEKILFYDIDEYGNKSLQVDYEICMVCGRKFIVSG
jgi:hypothetical protein